MWFGLIGHWWLTRSRKLNLSKLWDILAVYAWIYTGVDYIVKVVDRKRCLMCRKGLVQIMNHCLNINPLYLLGYYLFISFVQ